MLLCSMLLQGLGGIKCGLFTNFICTIFRNRLSLCFPLLKNYEEIETVVKSYYIICLPVPTPPLNVTWVPSSPKDAILTWSRPRLVNGRLLSYLVAFSHDEQEWRNRTIAPYRTTTQVSPHHHSFTLLPTLAQSSLTFIYLPLITVHSVPLHGNLSYRKH